MARFLCLLLMLMGASSSQALAHAALISSSPSDGAVVNVCPVSAVLQFNEPVSVTSVRVTGSDGAKHDVEAEVRQDQIVVALPSQLPSGTQVISYRVISADGHPVSGSILFSIGAATQAHEATSSGLAMTGAIWLARWALYIGLLGAVGGAFFVNWIAPGETPGWALSCLRAMAIAGSAALLLSVGLQGLDMLGEPATALLGAGAWAQGWTSSLGPSAMVGVLACAFAFLSLGMGRSGSARGLAALALAGTGWAFSLTGHASSAEPQWLMRTSVVLHGVAAAVWIGGLLPLAAVVHAAPMKSATAVVRFSGAATLAVMALVAAGIVLSVVQIETWSALLETDYGRLWIAKLSAVVLMLVLAALNRFLLTPAMSAGPQAGKRLVRSIAFESALALVLLAIVAGWRFTPPPRAAVAAPVSAIHAHLHGVKAWAHVGVRPARAGPVDLSAMILSMTSQPIDAKEVVFLFSNAQAGIEPLQRAAVKTPDGDWVVNGVILPTPGVWTLRAEVLISDFEKELMEGELEVSP